MIKSDSRRINPGDIFVALPGVKSDGHDYIFDAISRGASSVVVNHGTYSVDTICVSDTKEYLKKYVLDNYSSVVNGMTIIGVTGTNGKTTTSYLLYQSLNRLGVKCSMIGTLGFYKDEKVCDLPNTCPDLAYMYELLIDSYNSGYRCVVMEASSQGLAEDRLFGIKFDYALFTNLTHDHLDYHGNMLNYALSKRKLFEMLKDNGRGVVNFDDQYNSYFYCKNMLSYGYNGFDYKILKCNSFNFSFVYDSVSYVVNHNLLGDYNVYNLLLCIIVLHEFGYDFNVIFDVIRELKSPSGRMDTYNYLNNLIIVDYAHTPDAVDKVISSIKNYNKMYVVFGCTGNRDKSKRSIMTKILVDKCDYVIITSDDLYDEPFESIVDDMIRDISSSNYEVCYDRGEAIKNGISLLNNNDILFVLGKGHEKFIKVGSKKIPFNDGEYILNIINKVV